MKCVCVDDFRQHAKTVLKKPIFQYIDSGADEQFNRAEDSKIYWKITLLPRILVSSDNVDLSTNILNQKMNLPFGFAPSAMQQICHPDGQLIPAKVASQKNICYTLSLLSSKPLSQISQNNKNSLRLFQMYLSNDWQKNIKLIQLAQKYKFKGLVITVDGQVLGTRRAQKKYPIDLGQYKFPTLEQISQGKTKQRLSYLKNRDLTMNWETIKQLKLLTNLKIILKGITHQEDAKLASKVCDAIWISNHGGRQLDTILSPIEVLPRIKAAVGNSIEVYIDGGITTGTDIFKCLALGADYVFIGRPVMYSLVQGYQGVNNLVNILQDELKRTMILTGVKDIKSINPDYIKHKPSL